MCVCNFHVYIYILNIKTICGSKIIIYNYFNLFSYSLFIFLWYYINDAGI